MSTPPPDSPEQPSTASTPEQHPSPPAAPPAPPPPPAAAPPYAFTAVPREPWLNPSRRGSIMGGALVAGLLCVGAGFGIGFAVGHHHDRGDRLPFHRVVVLPGGGYGYQPGGNVGIWPGPRGARNYPPAARPSPAPSASSSG